MRSCDLNVLSSLDGPMLIPSGHTSQFYDVTNQVFEHLPFSPTKLQCCYMMALNLKLDERLCMNRVYFPELQ